MAMEVEGVEDVAVDWNARGDVSGGSRWRWGRCCK